MTCKRIVPPALLAACVLKGPPSLGAQGIITTVADNGRPGFRRPGRFFTALFLFAVTAYTASAQCYQFSGSGATLQIDITSFSSQNGNGPTSSNGAYLTNDYFNSNNTLTIGGTTQTSQSIANTPQCVDCLIGSVLFNYTPGNGAVTAFTMTVPANQTYGSMDSWLVVLGGTGDVIPTGMLPQPGAFPPISQWALPANEDNIVVNSGPGGMTVTDYPITAVGPCSSSSTGGSAPSVGGVVSASAFGAFSSVAPGSWVEIYGSNLATEMGGWTGSDFTNNTAPILLDGVSVSIGGQPAFVDYISPTQVNAQLPSNISTGGTLPLTVTNGSVTSPPINITVNTTEPGLLAPTSFKVGSNQYVVAQHTDGTYVLPTGAIAGVTSSPAKPGETIIIYGVGFGPVTPSIAAGEIVMQENQLTLPFQILFGPTPAQLPLPYSGLAPSLVGLYQFNVVVPAVADSNLVPLTFNLGGVAGTQTLFTAVQQ